MNYHCPQIFIYSLFISIGVLFRSFYPAYDISSSRFDNCNNTIILHQSDEKNLILTAGINIPLIKIYRFIRSARSACNQCFIIIFVNDINNDDYKQLAILYNVLFLSYDEYSPQEMRSLPSVSLRFLIYYQYLLKHQYDNIFLCDLPDVLFQKDIFRNMKSYENKQLYAFFESKELTIGGCELHREWILPCFGRGVLTSLYNESRSCAGSTLGTYKGIMRYLTLMNSHIRAQPKCNDQGIHNYIVYYILNDTSTIRIPHETGFLGTLGTSPWVYRNKYGLVLNKNNQVYSAIHQFYHSEQVTRQANQEYQILPEHILKLKS